MLKYPSMIQIERAHTKIELSTPELKSLQKQWEKQRAVLLPKLIEPSLLKDIQKALRHGDFEPIKHDGVNATEKRLNRDGTVNLLEMLVSEPKLSSCIAKITGKKPIGYFQGRVYNISQSDHDDWHHDAGYDYLMAVSINLSEKPYEGGSLQLRDAKTKKVYCDIQNIGPGDALIFDISKKLEHKITAVTGQHPKIAFAGWYCPKPHYEDYMNKVLERVMKKSRVKMKSVVTSSQKNKSSGTTQFAQGLAFRNVGKKTLIVNLADDSQVVLNTVASKIWHGLYFSESKEKTLRTIQKDYGLDYESAEEEYQHFVQDLNRIGYMRTT